ncbi:uncharacterized protein K452DRAFT_223784 [Aplosporella prunicola CBS 121167]|uniref:Helicase ATP-binding domain-containing protein n=1 Tax=Aplosporella prunicola CBS 121167 TaxID=1176127 RepID=A0A6A6BM37_9PEZI|nr:uncharacterized protein K452DRAFT_223784 [Aplosporella prunicola CBS 121167]KAF2144344.1 hypothetical protein K452DRAFT_223784 [Aplosporella prunicola CBS 121167]
MVSKVPESPDWGDVYGRLFSRRVDLVGDYAGSEPFLIEGDSLLLHCFSDDKLDFADGFQMLHAVWLVESFLYGLSKRNCNFHIAFFDDHERLCIPSHATDAEKAKYLLARAVILRHLLASLTDSQSTNFLIKVLIFPSIDSSSFHVALADNDYMFVMMNDGAVSECGCPEHVRDKTTLRVAICSFIARGYNVALVNGVEWRDTKVITAIIEGTAQLSNAIRNAPKSLANYEDPPFEVFDRERFDLFTKHYKLSSQRLSERLYLVAATIGRILSWDKFSSNEISAFLTHSILQSQLRLGARSAVESSSTENSQLFLEKFVEVARGVMHSPYWRQFVEEAQAQTDIADLVDGRLFNSVLTGHHPDLQLNEESQVVMKSMMTLISPLTDNQINPHDNKSRLNPEQRSQKALHSYRKLLPFTDQVFAKHLQPIKLNIDTEIVHLMGENSRTFRELTHWHNSRRPLSRKVALSMKERTAFYARRRDQRFMAEMMAYAASLTNAVGKALEPEKVVVQETKPAATHLKNGQQQPSRGTKSSKENKPTKKQLMLQNIAAKNEEKNAASASKVLQSWNLVCKDIDKLREPAVCHAKAMQYLHSLPSSKREVVGTEVEVFALSCLLKLWMSSITANAKSPDYGLAAEIWDFVGRLRNMPGLTNTIVSKLQQTVDQLGLPFTIGNANVVDRKLPFDFALTPTKSSELQIRLPSKVFQLFHCGPFFDRKMDSAPDDRVPFMPDGWQRKVLDAIDAEKSLFVVAPTSAGKTFISFYSMKKVLQSSDEGVLVYIAPTKALVNQIAAEIQARFSKSYKHAGKSVWGIHTRDYRINNSTGCQVLVTVPHILQIMLLSPSNANSWSSRIKRIIFDEVHCISQADDGIVWEQLLLLAPCPIIALSATVGNPQEFYEWLASAQKSIGMELVMVHHPHRYSDLRKFIYVPTKGYSFTGLPKPPTVASVGLDKGKNFQFVHPVASLLNRSRGMPEDFTLEARDCYTLWKAMKTRETETHKVPNSLNPEKALPAVITQADIINWLKSIKQFLGQWMTDQDSPFDELVEDLGGSLYELEGEEDTGLSADGLRSTVVSLLCHLHEQAALPAILFNYDRKNCEDLCKTVVKTLKEAEAEWKDKSPQWAKKMAEWDTWKKNQKNAHKKAAKLLEKVKGKAELEREMASVEPNAWESFNPNAPVDGFHFTDRTKLQESELDEYAEELERRHVPKWLIEALYRGIGVHHSGMNRKYRHVVELLFRKGYLQAVIATGTLALGINMPCKTVVFCGDSIFLTALNFRQAAGRAGRRGFDVLGNVVFHGIGVSKVCRLLSSRLPELTGHFPITTTLVLRLCTLLSESKYSSFAVRSVDALLSQPRLYLGGEENRMTVLHHLRFSLEYLRRQFLLDQSGKPLNFAGCISHLYYAEPSNFAFHALLKEGYFHQLCAGIRRNPGSKDRILETLMVVLCNIFNRRYCNQVDREFVENVVKRSPSMVFLPSLPKKAKKILREHNDETLDIFSTYVRTFVDQHVKEEDCLLPLSRTKFGGDGGDAPTSAIRSQFVALSGHGDNFKSISELCQTVRAGVFLEESAIPYINLEAELPLNAYLLDFFKHGDVTALVEGNKLRRGDVWFVLNDFSQVLATIITSLTNFIKADLDADDDALNAMGGGDAHEEEVEDCLYEMDAAPTEQKKALPVHTKVVRKKVVDNWDDDGEEDGADLPPKASGSSEGYSSEGDFKSPAWEGSSLLDVLYAFKKLADEFNDKFKVMWA